MQAGVAGQCERGAGQLVRCTCSSRSFSLRRRLCRKFATRMQSRQRRQVKVPTLQTNERYSDFDVIVCRYYLVFVTLFWNAVEAANMYLLLIKVFNSDVTHFALKAAAVADHGWKLGRVCSRDACHLQSTQQPPKK